MLNTRVVVTQYGGSEVLNTIVEPLRMPQKGELRIKVQSAGVALADIMRREGVYPLSPTPPFTPGYDIVGVVDELGEGMRQYSKGERVGAFFDGTGGYSAYVYATPKDIFPVPESIDAAQAVAVILNYVTAYQMLHRIAKVSEGENILIHGASGGVGSALLELGKLANVNMFGTASLGKHSSVSQFGATPIDYRNDDFVQVLDRLVPEGMDAVFDPVGGANWQRSFQTLGKKGRFVGYGYTSVLGNANRDNWVNDWSVLSETKQTDKGNPAFLYSITALRKENPDWFREDVGLLFSLLEQGKINPAISHRIPLSEAAYAQQLLEKSLSIGKVVLIGL
ncbi:zinc-binding dehydrogenase [Paenibacillus sp. LMG 31456]|uniref:Zinc-binding dehydrogenase n=1 Tax=Paenibacillus foliorum TaxID=2654974 RepID=A0A972GL13_9BACL|nr:medium chain dehydrogenase/reductase family protein [Paenibacillus foliorum]NOU92689.1 zinc-binding dehydrogenase [Paenibacillus foliorum]